jgi:hypothetical protein
MASHFSDTPALHKTQPLPQITLIDTDLHGSGKFILKFAHRCRPC